MATLVKFSFTKPKTQEKIKVLFPYIVVLVKEFDTKWYNFLLATSS